MAASLPSSSSEPTGKKINPNMIGLQPVKQLYMNVIDGVMDSIEEVFLDEGIDKEIWHELHHVWQSKLVDWNVLDQVVERPRPERNRHGLPIPPPRPLPPFCPANEQEKMPVHIEASIPECDSVRVTINIPFASIHDGKLQQALALPGMMDIVKDKDRIHTFESKVLEAIENLNAAAPLTQTDNTNAGNEPSTSAQHEPMDLSLSVAGPGPMSLSRQVEALLAKKSSPQQSRSKFYSSLRNILDGKITPTRKKPQPQTKKPATHESNAVGPSKNVKSKKLSKIKIKSNPEPVQGVSGKRGKGRPSKYPYLTVAIPGKANCRGRPKSGPVVIKREKVTLPKKKENECSIPSDHSPLSGTQPAKLNHRGKKSIPAVTEAFKTIPQNKRRRGRPSKISKMTVTEAKVSRREKRVRNPKEANQVEQMASGLLLKQENVSQAVAVQDVPNAAVMKIDGVIPPKKRGRPQKISCNRDGDRKAPNVIVKLDLSDQTETEITTPKRRGRSSKVSSYPPLGPLPKAAKSLTLKKRGRPSMVPSSPSPKVILAPPKLLNSPTPKRRMRPSKVLTSPYLGSPPPKAAKSLTPKKRGRPSKVPSSPTPNRRGRSSKFVSSAAHLDGATGCDDSDSDDHDQFVSRFGFSSSPSHNLANMAKIAENLLGTSVRNTEREESMEKPTDKVSKMGGQDPKGKCDLSSDSDWGDCETESDTDGDDDVEPTRREPSYSEHAVILPKVSMYCQYEKITRNRKKWKFILKDGIIHLDGKDYVFQKARGDSLW